MARKFEPSWDPSHHPARLWSRADNGKVTCHLSPRNCKIREGQAGFCGVRQNVGGRLITLNYGRATHITQESIETEAVFHYAPGAPILSLGNIGCMMNCDYCHNWKTSQARYVEDKDVHQYTPEEVVRMAIERNIPVISWTYNDPVVWQEFVIDTGRLARAHGLINLFKSAFFISLAGAEELCEVIDIFSVSIKTMDEKLYAKISKGWLPPVLEATKYVYDQGKHVEVSNLMVTDANDREEDARAMAAWILEHLSDDVPLHFVRFHPDYKYTHVTRTPIDRLVRAREVAMEMGIKYCYLGNVYGHGGVNTFCPNCQALLIERYGLNTWVRSLDDNACCSQCGMPQNIKLVPEASAAERELVWTDEVPEALHERVFSWKGDVKACHLEITNPALDPTTIFYWRVGNGAANGPPCYVTVRPQDSYRFIVSKAHQEETGIRIHSPDAVKLRLYEVYDRAHFPTQDVDTGTTVSDMIPLPLFS